LLGGEIAHLQRQVGGHRTQAVARIEHAFQGRDVLAGALGADLRQQTPTGFVVELGEAQLIGQRHGDTVLKGAHEVLRLGLVAGKHRRVDDVVDRFGVIGKDVAADPGP
jgi:hypothetical protein